MNRQKILIVDDDKDMLRGLSVRLKANGYSVFFAVDGLSAVSVARKEEPDVIILDIEWAIWSSVAVPTGHRKRDMLHLKVHSIIYNRRQRQMALPFSCTGHKNNH